MATSLGLIAASCGGDDGDEAATDVSEAVATVADAAGDAAESAATAAEDAAETAASEAEDAAESAATAAEDAAETAASEAEDAAESAATAAEDAAETAASEAEDAAETAASAAEDATDGTTEDTEATDDTATDDTATDDTATDGTAASGGGGLSAATGDSIPGDDIDFDDGVSEDTIRVGMLADLSGAFAPLVTEVVEAQQVYWDHVNETGGIAGRQVELVIEDNAYDVAVNVEKYQILRDQVAILSQVTGSPHTAAISSDMESDNLIGIPLTWYSGWADPEIGANVFETYTSYCLESMNAITWLHENRDVQTVAIVSFPGEFGGDGSEGAKMVAEQLGLEIVYDGAGQVTPPSADNPTPDQSAVVSQIVESDADLVWATVNPTALSSIMSAAVGQGFEGLWSGNSPTYSFKLLGTELAPALDEYYIASTYIVTWGTDVPGMPNIVDVMTEAKPELPVSDVYILGWTEAMVVQAILEQAAENGDLTREGIVAAANEVTVDFDGLAPTQTWHGDPNDYIVRESYIYDVTLDEYNPVSLGDGGGSTGWELLEGPYTSPAAADFDFQEACYVG